MKVDVKELFDYFVANGDKGPVNSDAVDALREAYREKLGFANGGDEDMSLVEFTNEIHKIGFEAGFLFARAICRE